MLCRENFDLIINFFFLDNALRRLATIMISLIPAIFKFAGMRKLRSQFQSVLGVVQLTGCAMKQFACLAVFEMLFLEDNDWF